jgi:bifunctional NMN adenylyltransferase/nudix hydrolase
MKDAKYTIGCLCGRFQVHELHEAHHYIIDQVVKNHKKVILFLGVPKVVGTKKNPLDFESRKKMIQHHYPEIVILALPDFSDDKRWSQELDKRIKEVYPIGDILMYGGRDSFIPYYKNSGGQFSCQELDEYGTFVSGTEVRKMISSEVKESTDFRAGVIYQSYNQYPKVHPCVDIAIMDGDKVLLAKRPYEDTWRFIGGFAKPTDTSYENTARRKVSDDVGLNLETTDLKYIGSAQVPDWRYQSEEDKIVTILFKTTKGCGRIEPSENVFELKFFNIKELNEGIIVNEHKILLKMLLEDLKK